MDEALAALAAISNAVQVRYQGGTTSFDPLMFIPAFFFLALLRRRPPVLIRVEFQRQR